MRRITCVAEKAEDIGELKSRSKKCKLRRTRQSHPRTRLWRLPARSGGRLKDHQPAIMPSPSGILQSLPLLLRIARSSSGYEKARLGGRGPALIHSGIADPLRSFRDNGAAKRFAPRTFQRAIDPHRRLRDSDGDGRVHVPYPAG